MLSDVIVSVSKNDISVLILIIMEYALRLSGGEQVRLRAFGLNPYYNGICSPTGVEKG